MVLTHWYQYAIVRARVSAAANALANPAGSASRASGAVSASGGAIRTEEDGSAVGATGRPAQAASPRSAVAPRKTEGNRMGCTVSAAGPTRESPHKILGRQAPCPVV